MGETSDQIERHIQETRNDLTDNLGELQEKVKTAFDWRAQFGERPMTMMALAFGGGVFLSGLLPTLRSPRRRSSATRRNAPSDRDVPPVSAQFRTAYKDKPSQTMESWDALKGALVGVAAGKLSGLIEAFLPGFKQEFTKAQTGTKFDRSESSNTAQPAWQKSTSAGAD